MGGDTRTRVKELIDAINAGERETVLAMVHDELVWRPTMWSGGGTYRGREGLSRWLDQFGPGLDHLRIEVAEIRATETGALVLGKVHDTRDGVSFGTAVGWEFVVEDGLIREARGYSSWAEAERRTGRTTRD